MPEKHIIKTHSCAGAYGFQKDMHNIGKNCRVEEDHTGAETEYLIYM